MAALPLPIIIGCVYKGLRLYDSRKRGERVALKWKEVGGIKRATGVLLIAYWSFLVYLAAAAVLNLTAIAVLPLSPIDSVIILTLATIGLVWLTYLQSVMSPRKTAFRN